MDQKNRIVLDKHIREISGIERGCKIVVIPFKGGVTLVDVTKKKFSGSLNGFNFEEKEHEGARFLIDEKKKQPKKD